jgi:hypothetical protein
VTGYGEEQELVQHHMEKCEKEHFPKIDEAHFEEFHLEKALCIPSTLHIGGKFMQENYEGVVVAIHMCDTEAPGNRCNEGRIADYFEKMTFSVIVEENTVNYLNYEEPIHADLSMVSFTHLYGVSETESRASRYDQSLQLIPSTLIDASN